MLAFFRRYQRIFFMFTTVIIVITFSFFGTGDSVAPTRSVVDEVVMTATDGRAVYRSEIDRMARFLATDSADKVNARGSWGFNFLNDGVVRQDILESGIGRQLIEQFREDIRGDFGSSHGRERAFVPYVHPQARFIGSEMVWATFNPELKGYYDQLQAATDPLTDDAIDARIGLFLAEKQFPAEAMRQILNYQQQQYDWVQEDPSLSRYDLNLFGYRSLSDWFGERFMHLASQFIVNAAAVAEQQGYMVTDAEVVADMLRSTQLSYQRNAQSPYLGVTNSRDYLKKQLQSMGMTENEATEIWRQVLLFRRLLDDTGQSVLVDGHMYRKLHSFARKGVEVDLYELPAELQLGRFEDLQQLEVYLDRVAERSGWDKDAPLALPGVSKSVAEVQQKDPELVEWRYLVRIAEADTEALQARVPIRDMWEWQTQNWEALKNEFPTLKVVLGDVPPLEVLDQVDASTRRRVDAHARSAIVAQHPEWIEETLEKVQAKRLRLGLRLQGGSLPIQGEVDRQALIKLLDAAPLSGESAETLPELQKFSADNRHFYRVEVLEKPSGPEILSFAEARRDGTLEAVTLVDLQQHYEKVRAGDVKAYRDTDGEWRPLREVRDDVARSRFAGIMRHVEEESARQLSGLEGKENQSPDRIVAYRLAEHMRRSLAALKADPNADVLVSKLQGIEGEEKVSQLGDQWKLVKRTLTVRRDEKGPLETEQVLQMTAGAWSNVNDDTAGVLSFYRVGEPLVAEDGLAEQMNSGQELLGHEARRGLAGRLIAELAHSPALTVDYFNVSVEAAE